MLSLKVSALNTMKTKKLIVLGEHPDYFLHTFFLRNTDKEGGTGLGLAICTSIVNEHKGNMAFENTEKGCTVTVELKK